MLALYLIGTPVIELDEAPIEDFGSAKVQALLFYLALNPEMHARDSLAALLWPEMSDRKALTNLRNTLSNLRKRIGDYLLTTRYTATLDRSRPFYLDVEEQTHLLTDPSSGDRSSRIGRAISLNRGELLAGFNIRDAEPFEEWLTVARSYLRGQQIDGLLALAQQCADAGDIDSGLVASRQILEMEPWHEEAASVAIGLLEKSGRRTEAIDLYRTLAVNLVSEFGVEPSYELRNRYARLLAVSHPIPTNLPGERDAFVGRRREIATLSARINDPAGRLFTILGPGGIGKSRLAIHVGRHFLQPQSHDLVFQDGVFLVMLERVHAHTVDQLHETHALAPATAMMHEILVATGGARRDNLPLRDQLRNHLRDKTMLIILDNFEHLLQAAPAASVNLLTDILTNAPSIKLLVTSRHRLRLKGEWLFTLEGLVLTVTADPQADGDAELLFIERGRQIFPDLPIDPITMATISQICQLVDGFPLAIELAACWLRVLTPTGILDEIRQGLDILTTESHDADDRHRSMQVVFASSWKMLDGDEQQALVRMSIFRGPFHLEAALAVADANLSLMLSLTNKSWLHRSDGQIFRQHEILRQFVEEIRLADLVQDREIRRAHAVYYAEWVGRLLPRLRGDQLDAIQAIQQESENIRLAWFWSMEQLDEEHVGEMYEALLFYFLATGRYREGANAFAASSEAFQRAALAAESRPQPVANRRRELAALMQVLEAVCLVALGRIDEAEPVLDVAEPILAAAKERQVRAYSLLLQLRGRIAYYGNDLSLAAELLEQAIAYNKSIGDAMVVAMDEMFLAMVELHQDRVVDASERIERSLQTFHRLNQPLGLGLSLTVKGMIEVRQGDERRAERHFRRSLVTFEMLGDNPHQTEPLVGLAALARRRGAYSDALVHLRQAQKIAEQAGTVHTHYRVLQELAGLATAMGHEENAAEVAWLLHNALDYRHLGIIHPSASADLLATPDPALSEYWEDPTIGLRLTRQKPKEIIDRAFAVLHTAIAFMT